MLDQRLREPFDETPQFLAIEILRRTRPTISFKGLEAWSKSAVLLNVTLHQTFDAGYGLDVWEESLLFGIVVMVHGLAPGLAVGQEVPGGKCVARWEVRRLEVDGVQAADDAVVSEGHLRRDIIGGVGGLARCQ